MAIYARMTDFDNVFYTLSKAPLIVNDYDVSDPEQKALLDMHIYTHYRNTDVIETSASCHCGKHTRAQEIGFICDNCHTEILPTVDRAIESTLWLRTPEGIDGFISPEVWSILEPALSSKAFDFLRYLISPTHHDDYRKIGSKEARRRVDKFLAFDPPRGINNFIKHFDYIMDNLFDRGIIDTAKANKNDLRRFIDENKQYFFPKYLPIPSRLCFVVETTASSTYIDVPLKEAMNAINAITSIKASQGSMTEKSIQRATIQANESLKNFYERYTVERLSKKPGVLRRHVFGHRLHMSARGVIDSISDPHYHMEIHIPWGMALQLLKYHILNKLNRRGYTAKEGISMIYGSVLRYNALIDEILNELIAEAPMIDPEFTDKHGIPVSLQRNPTLQRGSTQNFYISKVKTKTSNNTISMSPICLRAPNADFDGDRSLSPNFFNCWDVLLDSSTTVSLERAA